MSLQHRTRGEKPPIPPKPTHLLNSQQLPQPPIFTPENLENVIGKLKNIDVRHEEDDNYGYSEAAFTNDRELEKLINNQQPHFTVGKVAGTNIHREVPELVVESNNIVKDVRQRPLPLIPGEKKTSPVTNKPWYKMVNRREGEQLVRNGVDGYFLVRPSSKGESCLTLTLWYNNRAYNIPIRKRVDGLYALGTPKDLEQSFNTIEDMIRNYQKEELVLYSHGVETGKTTLKIYPA